MNWVIFGLGVLFGLTLAAIGDLDRQLAVRELLPRLRRKFGSQIFTAPEVAEALELDHPPYSLLRVLEHEGLLLSADAFGPWTEQRGGRPRRLYRVRS